MPMYTVCALVPLPAQKPSRFLDLECLCPAMGSRLLWDLLFFFPVHPLLLLFLVPCVTKLCHWFIVCLWGTSHCSKHTTRMGTFNPRVALVRQLLLPPAFRPGEAWDREVEPLAWSPWDRQAGETAEPTGSCCSSSPACSHPCSVLGLTLRAPGICL